MTAQPSAQPFALSLETDADYVSPAHVRTPFRSFLVSHDSGLYWLRMPAGAGKTRFVRGIIARRAAKDGSPEGIDSAISSGARAIAVGLMADASPEALVEGLKAAFEAEFACPAPDASGASASPEAFAKWLAALAGAVAGQGAKRLLVCIDGLEGADAETLALLPTLGAIPPCVVLLLTSRPAGDWPAERFATAAAKFAPGPAVGGHEIGLSDPDYVDALRKLFVERLRPLLRSRSNALLLSLMETRATYERGGRDARLTADPVLRDALKDDWKKLTNKFPRYSGQQLPVAPLGPVLDTFDRLWTDMLSKSEGCAGRFFPMVHHLAGGGLAVEEVADLPVGEALDARIAALG
ncbi:hypothetical protein [Xanthobacter sp.]|uniref:hypothetical protein n=1 Tax=Xanthobacter sp. TaxID=35809 RepID=UPI0025ECE627|nr:hypothetical protein [Xanthobacter sp.]